MIPGGAVDVIDRRLTAGSDSVIGPAEGSTCWGLGINPETHT